MNPDAWLLEQYIAGAVHLMGNGEPINLRGFRYPMSMSSSEYSTLTDPPTPADSPAHLSADESDELLHQPFNKEELFQLRHRFRAYHAGYRLHDEYCAEEERIDTLYLSQDEEGRRTYSGPDLEGRAGNERRRIMIRNAIRKRWERLGVWNPGWGMPNEVNTNSSLEKALWQWEWAEGRAGLPFKMRSGRKSWPSVEKETASDRALRSFIQEKGRWIELRRPTQLQGEIVIHPREPFIISRPWFQFELEIVEEARRLARVQRSGTRQTATDNTRNRWMLDGRWKDTWSAKPGWKWRDESPSPEPEDPNNMDFSQDEINRFNAIRSPSPPTTYPPRLNWSGISESESQSESRREQNENTVVTRDTDELHDTASQPDNASESRHFSRRSAKRQSRHVSPGSEDDTSPVTKRTKSERASNSQTANSEAPMESLRIDTSPYVSDAREDHESVRVRRSARFAEQNAGGTDTGMPSPSGSTTARMHKAQKQRTKK